LFQTAKDDDSFRTVDYNFEKKTKNKIDDPVESMELLKEDELPPLTGNQLPLVKPISSILLLNIVTIIWGTQHAVIKAVLMEESTASSPTSAFTFCRFLLALLLVVGYTPSLMADSKEAWEERKNDWRWGLEMGFWMFLGYV